MRIVWWDSANNVYYYFEDHLGSSRVITQGNGTVCYDADYDPFGKEVVVTNTCPQNYKFNGKERDAESNLDDFGARYYSSQFGRWTSADWSGGPSTVPYAELVNPQSLNLYAYARNNPVTSADLDGHVVAQDTANKMANDLGGQGSWSPRGEEQETGREFDTTDYSSGRLIAVTYATPMSDGTIFTEVRVEFYRPPDQQQNKSAPPNSRTDVVLHGREYVPSPNRDYPLLWTMDWKVSQCSATDCSPQSDANKEQTITLVESLNKGPWKPSGDPIKSEAHDQISLEPKTFDQRWYVDGKQVQLVIGKDSGGNLIKVWQVHGEIKKYGEKPIYSAGP